MSEIPSVISLHRSLATQLKRSRGILNRRVSPRFVSFQTTKTWALARRAAAAREISPPRPAAARER